MWLRVVNKTGRRPLVFTRIHAVLWVALAETFSNLLASRWGVGRNHVHNFQARPLKPPAVPPATCLLSFPDCWQIQSNLEASIENRHSPA